jgi:hypothetical protein
MLHTFLSLMLIFVVPDEGAVACTPGGSCRGACTALTIDASATPVGSGTVIGSIHVCDPSIQACSYGEE